jgi:uncharacterized CHY-type Zn-finger protein
MMLSRPVRWAALAVGWAVLAAPGAAAVDAVAADAAGTEVAAPAAASAASSGYRGPVTRSLRDNQPPAPIAPTEPEVFRGYPGAPAFTVAPRKPHLALFPCTQCHGVLPLNTTPRKLVNAPHQASLQHGRGRFWCLDCHQGNDRDMLHTVGGTKVDFDQSYLVCGQCHSARQRDWYFGGHGKRVAGWKGEREIYACTYCHDPHNPSLQPRAPKPPPPLRAGLEPMKRSYEPSLLPWQRPSQGAPDGSAATKP